MRQKNITLPTIQLCLWPEIGSKIPERNYLYYDSFDGVNIPYAITGVAINYYSGLIEDFNSHKKDNFFISANFEYKVEIVFYENLTSPTTNSKGETVQTEEFNSVFVVKMPLKWEVISTYLLSII